MEVKKNTFSNEEIASHSLEQKHNEKWAVRAM